MTEFEQTKEHIIGDLIKLCARCKERIEHVCPIGHVIQEIEKIRGIPIMVNSKLWHVVFHLTPTLSHMGEGERAG